MKYSALVRRTPLRRVSARRAEQIAMYWSRRAAFLRAHPYCQLWLKERGVSEAEAIREKGVVVVAGRVLRVPRSRDVHHRNKRRGGRLLDESQWMAVAISAHRRIETNKAWSRARGHLRPF